MLLLVVAAVFTSGLSWISLTGRSRTPEMQSLLEHKPGTGPA